MAISFSGYVSPFPGWEDVVSQMIIQGLGPVLGNVTIGIDKSQEPTLGVWTINLTTSGGSDLTSAQQTIQSVLQASSVNLDPGSIHIQQLPATPPMVIDYTAPNAPPPPVVPVAVLPAPITPVLPPVTQTVPVSTPVVPVVPTPVPVTPTATLPAVTQAAPAAAKPAISPVFIVVGVVALLFLSSGK